MKASPKRLLAVSLGGLGDFITRWPLFQSLRRSFPGARIVFLGNPRQASLLSASGLCDEALDFEDARFSLPGACEGRFDLVVSILGERGREWLGRVFSGSPPRLIEVEPFPPAGARIRVGEHIVSRLHSLGLADAGPLELRLPDDAEATAGELLRALGLGGKPPVAIHPGSGGEWKNWPIRRFIALSRRLADRGDAVLALSGEAEAGLPAWPPGVVPVKEPDLVLLAALLAACRWYVGNDCGVSHLAALAGVPSTVIFGPTDADIWAPRGKRVTVVSAPVRCAPCGREKAQGCRERRCLEGVTVEEVLKTIVPPGRSHGERRSPRVSAERM